MHTASYSENISRAEHNYGSEGAYIIFIQSVLKSQKHSLILYSEFEPNSRQTVLRQPNVIDNEVPTKY